MIKMKTFSMWFAGISILAFASFTIYIIIGSLMTN